MSTIANWIGIIGVAVILFAFFYSQLGRWKIDHFPYLVANALGSAAILFSLFYAWNLPAVLMEVAWLGVSFLGMIRTLHKQRAKQKL